MLKKKHYLLFLIFALLLCGFFLLDLISGQVSIPLNEVFKIIFGQETTKSTWEYIIINYRLPKAITAVLVGMGLSVSGLLMQTLFRNPLAGPYVLGLSSGSSLGVAFVILSAGILPSFLNEFILSPYGIVLASCLGSFLVVLAILVVAQRLRNTMSLLIVGLMFGSFAGAVVNVMSYFSSAEQLQKFTFWSMGNLGNLPWSSIGILGLAVSVGLLLSLLSIKSLDALLLGENYAKSVGMNFKKVRFIIIIATSILAGSITAFAGPIAFIGLAVPHISKLIFQTSNHKILFFSTVLIGGILMLFCDIISQMPYLNTMLPINAITSIIGAPVVIWLLMGKKNLQ
ncbi:iron ABC transporter permease [Flavobacterium sp.]|uniref:iron ABC transporter permease n=1 Tax=Flavobacterium sp. TaxID=239 RepID=UPI00261A9573|nr:iron ABC transporter permease [Flavobacterium sp.]MDD3003889.1 iron ABC transporter permease [Flavobacterium sp.]